MIIKKIFRDNEFNFINYFVRKEDRKKIDPKDLYGTWTYKILYSKKNPPKKNI